MKLGLIFRKGHQEEYGHKQEFYGNKITINNEGRWITIKTIDDGNSMNDEQKKFPVGVIQLIYFGEWNL